MNELKGKKILVTRTSDGDSDFENILSSHGASVTNFPVIEIRPVEYFKELDNKISALNSYDGIFFTSTNAVRYFFDRIKQKKAEFSGNIYAVGSKTKASVESYGYKVYFTSPVFSAEELASSINKEEIKGKKFLFPRGNLSRDVLIEKLGAIADIDDVVVYETILPENNSILVKKIENILGKGEIDCISFFSPSAVENFLKIFPGFMQNNVKIAVIGKTTAESALSRGLRVDIIPVTSTAESVAEAIADCFSTNR